MSGNHNNGGHESGARVAQLSTRTRTGALLFRVVGPRRWPACEGKTRLKSDGPTLNPAKKLCRASVGDGERGLY
jgi:hypothetical protein